MARDGSQAPAAVTAGHVLRDPISALAVAVALAVAIAVTFSYLYGFIDPDGNLRDLPVGLVVEDAGATVDGEQVAYSPAIAASFVGASSEESTVKWVQLRERAAVLAALADNRLDAGVIIPEDYSARIVALGDARTPLDRAAQIFGVPAAGGVYPAEAMPGLFRSLSAFTPLRYLTDGLRSILWFDSSAPAGLSGGIKVLAGYAAVCVAASGALEVAFDRRRAPRPTPIRHRGAMRNG